jgi:hypothetical protein
MRLLYAFVADSAQFTADGKLWVLGGDFATIQAPAFPATHLAMTLVVKLEVQLTECNRDHRLRVVLLDPDGGPVIPEVELSFRPQSDPRQHHRPVGVGLNFVLQQIQFPKAGDYGFHVLVDDLELGVVPLYLVSTAPALEPNGGGNPMPEQQI